MREHPASFETNDADGKPGDVGVAHPRASSAAGSNPPDAPGVVPERSPGDEAMPGTVGTGEDVCPRCAGSGRLNASQACPDCDGSGVIIQGIGGG